MNTSQTNNAVNLPNPLFVPPEAEITEVEQGINDAGQIKSSDLLLKKLDETQAKMDLAMKQATKSYDAVEKTETNVALHHAFTKQMDAYRMVLENLRKTIPGNFAAFGNTVKTNLSQAFGQLGQFVPTSIKNIFTKQEGEKIEIGDTGGGKKS